MDRLRTENPFLAPPIKIASFFDVGTYLKETGRLHLCKNGSEYLCDKWEVEPVLLKELETSPDKNRLRGLIRALSNQPIDTRSNAEILRNIDTERRLNDPHWQAVETIFGSAKVGEEIEDVVQSVEAEYAHLMARWQIHEEGAEKERLKRDIDRLRPIRDRLYLRRIHPEFVLQMLQQVSIRQFIPRPRRSAA